MKTKIAFGIFILTLFSLWFVDNIAIKIGDENTYISEEEFYSNNHPGINCFGESHLLSNDSSAIDMDDFTNFLSEMGTNRFYRKEVSYLDTTGDGELETVNSIVELKNGECLVHNYIEKDGRRIWEERAIVNEDMARMTFQDEDLIDELKPYALFYLGLLKSDFTEEIEGNLDYEKNKMRLAYKDSSNSNEIDIKQEMLNRYRGMFVFSVSEGHRTIHIWNEDSGSFQPIYRSSFDINPA